MNNQLNNDQDGKRPDNKDPRQGSGKNHQSILAFLICLLVTLVCFALFTNMLKDNRYQGRETLQIVIRNYITE